MGVIGNGEYRDLIWTGKLRDMAGLFNHIRGMAAFETMYAVWRLLSYVRCMAGLLNHVSIR